MISVLPVGEQQLVVAQIDGRALDTGTILPGGFRLPAGTRRGFWQPQAQVLTSAWGIGDLQLRFGQIEDLPALDAVRSLFRQGTSAARAALDRVTHCAIRLGRRWADYFCGRRLLGLGLQKTVRGRWLAAVV